MVDGTLQQQQKRNGNSLPGVQRKPSSIHATYGVYINKNKIYNVVPIRKKRGLQEVDNLKVLAFLEKFQK